MLNKTLFLIIFLLFACATCFAQTTFMGITPGKSTKADVERVLGFPKTKVSETLIEYHPQLDASRLYVQYRDKSAMAVVERIELICSRKNSDGDPECPRMFLALDQFEGPRAMIDIKKDIEDREVWYFGSPRFIVDSKISGGPGQISEFRSAFYSKELYEAVAPRGGCTGTMLGEWETNRGRMAVMRLGNSEAINGTFSTNNGRITGEVSVSSLSGEWKDETGGGTMALFGEGLHNDKFHGTWKRNTGVGPAEGKWEGRCIASTGER